MKPKAIVKPSKTEREDWPGREDMPERTVVQIAATEETLYGLSDDGRIFALRGKSWREMPPIPQSKIDSKNSTRSRIARPVDLTRRAARR